MSSAVYELHSHDISLTHGRGSATWLKDIDESLPDFKTLVASDELFSTLAAMIDTLSDSVQTGSLEGIQEQLATLSVLLDYLQRHYRVTRKPNPHQ